MAKATTPPKSQTKKTTISQKSTSKSQNPKRLNGVSWLQNKIKAAALNINKKKNGLLARRPHRSFRLTRRRDYVRSFALPGYWSFTNQVRKLLWGRKWLFAKFLLLYGLLSALIVGIMSQENYKLLNETIHSLGDTALNGQVGEFTQNIAIFSGVLAGAFNAPLSESQQAYGGLLLLMGWMTAIWLLRQIMAGHKKVKLRDGLYSSGAPLVSTFLILMIILLQLIPAASAVIGYAAAEASGIFDETLFTTFFWILTALLTALSAYWVTSSLIAFVIVTLPGMYPLKAIKAAGDLVVGRRLRVLYRLAWLVISIVVTWGVVVIPTILIDAALNIDWLPLVPVAALVLSAFTLLWSSAYIYLLYRKLVDDGASPA